MLSALNFSKYPLNFGFLLFLSCAEYKIQKMTCFICSSPSVPDLSEYRVWLGVSDIREGAPDLSKKQEVSISHVICGPEGSSLVLVRLSQ